MKKSLIVLALASIGSSANAATSNVDVSGKMRMYVESYKTGTAGALTRVTNDTSRVVLKANEDLGGGLGVNVVIDTTVGADSPSATTIGDRQSTIGIGTKTMQTSFGRDKHNLRKTIDQFDAMGVDYGTTADAVHSLRGSRMSNAASITADLGVATASYTHGFSETAGTDATQSYSLAYNQGPLKIGYAGYDNNTGSKSQVIGGKITLGTIGLMGMYSKDETAGAKSTGKSVGFSEQVTPSLTAYIGYGTNENVDAYSAKATYALSKRTLVHAVYSNIDSTVAANDVTQFGIGLEHNF